MFQLAFESKASKTRQMLHLLHVLGSLDLVLELKVRLKEEQLAERAARESVNRFEDSAKSPGRRSSPRDEAYDLDVEHFSTLWGLSTHAKSHSTHGLWLGKVAKG